MPAPGGGGETFRLQSIERSKYGARCEVRKLEVEIWERGGSQTLNGGENRELAIGQTATHAAPV